MPPRKNSKLSAPRCPAASRRRPVSSSPVPKPAASSTRYRHLPCRCWQKPPCSICSRRTVSEMSPIRLNALRLRADLYAVLRAFFSARGVLEVETPMLSAAGNTDPNIESFTTEFSGHVDAGARRRWLRTSPEFPLKRLLAEGLGDCYELGRVFR